MSMNLILKQLLRTVEFKLKSNLIFINSDSSVKKTLKIQNFNKKINYRKESYYTKKHFKSKKYFKDIFCNLSYLNKKFKK